MFWRVRKGICEAFHLLAKYFILEVCGFGLVLLLPWGVGLLLFFRWEKVGDLDCQHAYCSSAVGFDLLLLQQRRGGRF
jgi:hypothetical protein